MERSNFNRHRRLSIYRRYRYTPKFDTLNTLCLHRLHTRGRGFIVNRKYLFLEHFAFQPDTHSLPLHVYRQAIIARRYASGVWLKQAWSEYTARELDAEQADTIATHFQTEGGQKLRDRVAAEQKTTFASHYTAEISLAEVLDPKMMAAYNKKTTGEKYLIVPTKGM